MNLKTLLIVTSVLISGCTTLPQSVESWEYAPEPIVVKQARRTTSTITWVQVPNNQLQEICQKAINGRFANKQIAGCAVWYPRGNSCTVITGMETTTSTLGHEVRHCYDYDFHN